VTRLTHLALLMGLLVIIMAFICWSMLSAFFMPNKVAHAFDDTLLAVEPFQIGDIRAALAQAQVLVARNDWSMSLRLIRDCRNQWEAFVPVMRTAYTTYAWSDKDIQQAIVLWNNATNAASRQNASQVNRYLQHLGNLIEKYRVRSISRVI
jgi:hypothetical protein